MKEAPLPSDPTFKSDERRLLVEYYHAHPSMEPTRDVLMYVHHQSKCQDQPVCGIHKPTPHAMSTWPRFWSSYQRFMYRLCEHMKRHPDPDEVAYREWAGMGIMAHECDGCCTTNKHGTEGEDDLPF